MAWVHNGSPGLDQQSEWPLILGVCLSLTTLMTFTVFLRIHVRARMIKSIGLDDYVIIFSMVCSIIYNGLCIGQSRYGLGLPLKLRPAMNLDKYSEINFSGRPFYMAGITGFKVALCYAYLRITGSNIMSQYRKFIWSFMVFTILSHLGGTLVLVFQCKPIHKSWRPQTDGKCLPNGITFYVLAAITIVCDVVIFLMPIPLLIRVQINLRRKVGLIGIFTLGLFTTVCSIMRMVQIITINKNGNSTMLVLWGTIEMNVGIFLTCLPSLTPLFTFFAQKSKSSKHGVYPRSGGSRGSPKYNGGISSQASDPLKMHKISVTSQFSDTTVVQRSDSEEEILPMGVALAMCGEKGYSSRPSDRKARRESSILKTTEVEVRGDEEENEKSGHEEIEMGSEKGRVRRSQRGW